MKNENVNVIAVESENAGAVAYWRLSGDTVLADLASAWQAQGLDTALLPPNPSAEVTLRRALVDQESALRKAIKIKGGDFKGGWALVAVDTSDGHVKIEEVLRAKLTGGRVEIDSAHSVLAEGVEASFKTLSRVLATADVSSWLIKLAQDKAAVSLRESGGVYFVPRVHVDFWAKVAKALGACGDHRIFRIPAMKAAEAVEAILDGVAQEAMRLVSDVEADIGEVGGRALQERQRRCDAMLIKIREYEELLGVKMIALHERVAGLAVNVAAAALAA